MKRDSELQKVISAFMLFVLLIEFTGCYSTKIIPTSDLTSSTSYMIHCKKASYPVYNVEIADSILTGKIDIMKMKSGTGDKTHIYLTADSVLKFNNDMISFPVQYISRVEKKVPDTRKTRTLTTFLIVAGCVGLGIGLIALTVSLANSAVEVMYPTDGSTGFCTNW